MWKWGDGCYVHPYCLKRNECMSKSKRKNVISEKSFYNWIKIWRLEFLLSDGSS